MIPSVSLCATLATVMAVVPGVSATNGQLGFALGVKQTNGACKVQADYEADMDAIHAASGSKMVRVFDASECDVTSRMLPAAKKKGFRVILGIWPDTDAQFNAGKSTIVSHAAAYHKQIYAVTVGSEGLYRGTYTAPQLVGRIRDMRAAVPQLRYGTADSWNKYADGAADPVVPVSDILLVNAFAYWQGAPIDAAVGVFNDDISQGFGRVRAVAGTRKVELWVGETGWPTAGTTYQNAVPSLPSAERFYREGVCAKIKAGTNVFAFEAFDEPWKPVSIGQDGNPADETHWGAMTANRQAKYPLKC